MARRPWDARSSLTVAVLVDVDGTLVGPYEKGVRHIRPTAIDALTVLSRVAPVFLWSIVGADNARRLVREFPAIEPLIAGCYGKDDFPLHLIETAYAIDDEDIDDAVRRCRGPALVDTYQGANDSGLLLEAARRIASLLSLGS